MIERIQASASIAARVAALVMRVGPTAPLVATGGVACNAAAITALSAELDQPVEVAPDPQFIGAIGAALLAANVHAVPRP